MTGKTIASDEDITISTNTTWDAGTYEYRDITVTNNATLTLNGTYTTDTDGAGVIINARNIIIDNGASVSATGKGYAANAGLGKGGIYTVYGGGASHGGTGGNHAISSGGSTVIYGSATAPATLGSGGGNGGAGGGAVSLNLAGNIILNGSIYAKGNNGGSNTGGGSGGSIHISTVDITGSGTISANGGNAGGNGGGGGGGRVAIYYSGTNSFPSANITVGGGTGSNAGSLGSRLIYDKNNKDCTIDSNITFDPNMGIDANGLPATNGIFNFRNLTINNNANLYNKIKYTTDSDGVGIELKITGELNVATGSKIDGVGRGYPIGVGEGKPTGLNNAYGAGGGHGGDGGRGDTGIGGARYDSTLFPVKPGSGGYTTRGGAGGSAIKITATDVIVDGSIDQSASAPTASGSTKGSGAAGGSVYIIASTVSGSGTIKADASDGTGSSGGGGGGRIAIYADTTAFNTANITAAFGKKGGVLITADGSPGTVFLYDTVSGNVSASSDVFFEANQGVNRDGTLRTDGVFYFNNLTVNNNATVTIGGYYTNDYDGRGVTLNLDGNLTIESGSKITATAQGYTGSVGQGKGTGTSSTSGSGGSYGGLGGKSYNNNLASAIYDSTKANYPYALGSGGGAGTGTGGKGGGAVTLRVLGNIINNGEISADGASGSDGTSSWRPGGGSGGSVFINCDVLSGSGMITAKGGDGLGNTTYGSGGGGGGRISIVYSSSQTLPLANFSAAGGAGGGSVADRSGAEGSVNISQRILPAADFVLENPNNGSTEFTNTENVEIVPTDGSVQKYKEAASAAELVPTFYAEGWNNVTDGKDVGATEGTKTVRAWFKDGNELISSSVGTASIILDKTKPSAEIRNNNQTVNGSTINIELALNDDLSGVDYITVRGQRVELASLSQVSVAKASSIKAYAAETTFETTVSLDEGENSIPVVVYDKAGNSSEIAFVATKTASAVASPAMSSSATTSPVADSTSTNLSSSGPDVNTLRSSSDNLVSRGSSETTLVGSDTELRVGANNDNSEKFIDKISELINPLSVFTNSDHVDERNEKPVFAWTKLLLFAGAILCVTIGLGFFKKKKL